MTAVLLILVLSPFIGSFLGVLADRLPRGESVIAPRSSCRSCATPLSARDLLPALSYLLSRGQCRHCGAAIPPWLLYTELAAFGLALIAVALGGTPFIIVLSAIILWLSLTLTITDIIWFRLPDPLTGAMLVSALMWSAITGVPSLNLAIFGAVLGAGSFLVIRLAYRGLRGREGLGLGDVKLMAGLGALVGPHLVPAMVLVAALGALGAALLRPRRLSATSALPFGAALSISAALLWVLNRSGLISGFGIFLSP